MKNTQFPASTPHVAKASVDLEREKEESNKRLTGQVLTANTVNEPLTPYLNCAWKNVKLSCDGVVSQSFWKYDSMEGLASCDV